jgi:hypothetical protein
MAPSAFNQTQRNQQNILLLLLLLLMQQPANATKGGKWKPMELKHISFGKSHVQWRNINGVRGAHQTNKAYGAKETHTYEHVQNAMDARLKRISTCPGGDNSKFSHHHPRPTHLALNVYCEAIYWSAPKVAICCDCWVSLVCLFSLDVSIWLDGDIVFWLFASIVSTESVCGPATSLRFRVPLFCQGGVLRLPTRLVVACVTRPNQVAFNASVFRQFSLVFLCLTFHFPYRGLCAYIERDGYVCISLYTYMTLDTETTTQLCGYIHIEPNWGAPSLPPTPHSEPSNCNVHGRHVAHRSADHVKSFSFR